MSLPDSLNKIFHRKTVRLFNDFMQNHSEAVRAILRDYVGNNFSEDLRLEDSSLWKEYMPLTYHNLKWALLDKKFKYRQMKIVVEKRDLILKLYDVYQEIDKRKAHLKKLSATYPKAIRTLCDIQTGEHWISYDSLNAKQVKEILKSEKDFPRLESLLTKYSELKKTYPQGLNTFLENNKDVTFDLIVKAELEIKQLEEAAKKSEEYDKWESEQSEFATECRNLRDKILKDFGCYNYYIPFSKIDKTGKKTEGRLVVWQIFAYAFCSSVNLDYTHCQKIKQNYEALPLVKRDSNIIPDNIYQKITDYINSLAEKRKTTVFIHDEIEDVDFLFGDSRYYDIFDGINAKSKFIRPASTIWFDGLEDTERHIIIIDIITENDFLKSFCNMIIEHLKDKHPLITYISIMKGYSEEEMQEIINQKNAEFEAKRQKEIEIKFENEVLKKVERRSYYIDFCKAKNIKEQHQKEYILQHLQDLDSYIPIAKRNEAQRLITMACYAGWESRFGDSIRTFSLYNYYPTTCEWEADAEDWGIRNLVWNFKNSQEKAESWRPSRNMFDNPHIKYIGAINTIIPLIKKVLVKTFGDDLSMLTLACIPASTKINTSRRYARFSEQLCARTNMINGYDYIKILQEGQARHLGGNISTMVECDKDFFKGKFVILFDDVITRGNSMMRFKRELENCGAYVIGGMSVGRTKHEKVDMHPIDELEQASSINTSIMPF